MSNKEFAKNEITAIMFASKFQSAIFIICIPTSRVSLTIKNIYVIDIPQKRCAYAGGESTRSRMVGQGYLYYSTNCDPVKVF